MILSNFYDIIYDIWQHGDIIYDITHTHTHTHTYIYIYAISLIYIMILCMISYFCNDIIYVFIILYIIYDIMYDIIYNIIVFFQFMLLA
jgi:hypothetical protein